MTKYFILQKSINKIRKFILWCFISVRYHSAISKNYCRHTIYKTLKTEPLLSLTYKVNKFRLIWNSHKCKNKEQPKTDCSHSKTDYLLAQNDNILLQQVKYIFCESNFLHFPSFPIKLKSTDEISIKLQTCDTY